MRSSRIVPIQPRLAVHGRLSPQDGRELPRYIVVTVARDDPALEDEPWVLSYDDVTPTGEGEFELPAPVLSPAGVLAKPGERPRLVVEVFVAGYEVVRVDRQLDGARLQELGVLNLYPVEPNLELKKAVVLLVSRKPCQTILRLDNTPGVSWIVRGWRLDRRDSPTGLCDVSGFLDRVPGQDLYRARLDATGEIVERSFPLLLTQSLIVEVAECNPLGTYQSLGGGVFGLDEVQYDLAYECRRLPDSAEAWWFGYSYKGMHQPLMHVDELRPKLGRDFRAPAEGVTVWWSDGPQPPNAGAPGGVLNARPRERITLVLE
jgi:hypothetical protein